MATRPFSVVIPLLILIGIGQNAWWTDGIITRMNGFALNHLLRFIGGWSTHTYRVPQHHITMVVPRVWDLPRGIGRSRGQRRVERGRHGANIMKHMILGS